MTGWSQVRIFLNSYDIKILNTITDVGYSERLTPAFLIPSTCARKNHCCFTDPRVGRLWDDTGNFNSCNTLLPYWSSQGAKRPKLVSCFWKAGKLGKEASVCHTASRCWLANTYKGIAGSAWQCYVCVSPLFPQPNVTYPHSSGFPPPSVWYVRFLRFCPARR
jgi:hypothetical protein